MGIEDIFNKDDAKLVRNEAGTKYPNCNFDKGFNDLFSDYVDVKYGDDVYSKVATEESIILLFMMMVELNYSPKCISYYQQIWERVKYTK